MKKQTKPKKPMQKSSRTHTATATKKHTRNIKSLSQDSSTEQYKFGVVLVFCAVLLASSFVFARAVKSNRIEEAKTVIQSIRKDAIAISLVNTTYDAVGIPHFWEPAEGKQFVMVDLNVANNSSQIVHFSPITSLVLLDADGIEYPVTAAPNIKTGLGGPINPSATAQGEVGFEVPLSKSYRIQYDSNGVTKTIPLAAATPSVN